MNIESIGSNEQNRESGRRRARRLFSWLLVFAMLFSLLPPDLAFADIVGGETAALGAEQGGEAGNEGAAASAGQGSEGQGSNGAGQEGGASIGEPSGSGEEQDPNGAGQEGGASIGEPSGSGEEQDPNGAGQEGGANIGEPSEGAEQEGTDGEGAGQGPNGAGQEGGANIGEPSEDAEQEGTDGEGAEGQDPNGGEQEGSEGQDPNGSGQEGAGQEQPNGSDDVGSLGNGEGEEAPNGEPEEAPNAGPEEAPMAPAPAPATYTVTFMVGDTLFAQHQVQDGAPLPVIATPNNPDGFVSFVGWFENPTADETETPYDVESPVRRPLTLHAVFSTKYLLQFVDGFGDVVSILSKRVAPEEVAVEPTEEEMAHVDLPSGMAVSYWTEDPIGVADPARFYFGEDTFGEIQRDVRLRPALVQMAYVNFVTYSGQLDAVAVPVGKSLADVLPDGLPNPAPRDKYTFVHWSLSEDAAEDNSFEANAIITENVVLYAYWAPVPNSATYSIAYFLERPNIPVDHDLDINDKNDFELVKLVEDQVGTPDATVTVDSLPDRPTDINDPMRYAELFEVGEAVISPNDDTVINVYAKRSVYTLTFLMPEPTIFYWHDASMTIGGVTYSDNNPYSIQMKYGLYIGDVFPVAPTAEFDLGRTWGGIGSPCYFEVYVTDGKVINEGAPWVSRRAYADVGMMPKEPTISGYSVRMSVTTDSSTYTTRYFYEALPGQQLQSGDKSFVGLDGVTYIEDQSLVHIGEAVTPKPIVGMRYPAPNENRYEVIMAFASNSANSLGDRIYDINGKTAAYRHFLYKRVTNTFTYVNYYADGTSLTVPNVMFGMKLHQDPAPEGYESLYIAEPPERPGYEFVGWYKDATGLRAFDWNATMPANPYAVFAKWVPTEVTVNFRASYGGEALLTTGTTKGGVIPGLSAIEIGGISYVVGADIPGRGIFLGWYYYNSAGVRTRATPDMRVYGDEITLFAQWRQPTYSITYSKGGADYDGALPVDDSDYQGGSSARVLNLPEGRPNVDGDGKIFVGWRIANAPDQRLYYPYSLIYVGAGNIVLTPVFAAESEITKVIFHINVTGRDETVQINYWRDPNEEISIALPSQTELGWDVPNSWIRGWQTEPGGGTFYALDNGGQFPLVPKTEVFHLHAVWRTTVYDIEEWYLDDNDALLLPATAVQPLASNPVRFEDIAIGSTYEKAAPKFEKMVAYGYEIFIGNSSVGSNFPEHGSDAAIGEIKAVIASVENNYVIKFHYKSDGDEDGIPDDKEKYPISERFYDDATKAIQLKPDVTTDVGPDQGYAYSRQVSTLLESMNEGIVATEWVPVGYYINGGEMTSLPRIVVGGGGGAKGAPVNMEATLTFRAPSTEKILYVYKPDTNGNRIPDDEEGGPYTIAETYVDADDTADPKADLIDATQKVFPLGGPFNYTMAAPFIENYVAVGYVDVDGEETLAPANTDGTIPAVTLAFEVTASGAVQFLYEADENDNGKPDDEEGPYTIAETYVDADDTADPKTGLITATEQTFPVGGPFGYTKTAPFIENYVAVGYVDVDGEETLATADADGTIPAITLAFEVTASGAVQFLYEADENDNGKPDDDEGPYTIAETYVDADDTADPKADLIDATQKVFPLGGPFNYTMTAPVISGYVAVGYVRVDGAEWLADANVDGTIPAITLAFEVTASGAVQFLYEADENDNGKPDDEEGPYTIAETYVDADDTADPKTDLITATEQTFPVGGPFGYTKTAPFIENYVAVGYVDVDGAQTLATANADGTIPAITLAFEVTASGAVQFLYEADENDNNIPDDEEGPYTIAETYVDADDTADPKADLIPATSQTFEEGGPFNYTMAAPAIPGYVAVGYVDVDGAQTLATANADGTIPAITLAFEVTASGAVQFLYEADENDNGKPDDEEGPYTIAETYVDADDTADPKTDLITATEQTFPVGGPFGYTKTAPFIENYVAVGYVDVDGAQTLATANADGTIPAITLAFEVTASGAVQFLYEADENDNGKPDDEEGPYTITELYVNGGDSALPEIDADEYPATSTPLTSEDGFVYAKDAPDIEDWVAVGFKVGESDIVPAIPDLNGVFPQVTATHVATGNETVRFVYMADVNDNDIPDDHEEDIVVHERYIDYDNQDAAYDIADPTSSYARQADGFVYSKAAPDIADYVAVGYYVDDGEFVQAVAGENGALEQVTATFVANSLQGQGHVVRFAYKLDTNGNDIPEDEEGPYTIGETYVDADDTADPKANLIDATEQTFPLGGQFNYTMAAPVIPGYVAVGYVDVDGEETLAPANADGTMPAITLAFEVTANGAVQFLYEKDTNNNGIPDDEESEYIDDDTPPEGGGTPSPSNPSPGNPSGPTTVIDDDPAPAAPTQTPAPTEIIDDEQAPGAGIDVFDSRHLVYIVGYPDGSVRPAAPITRAEMAAIIFRLLAGDAKNDPLQGSFSDVPEGEWYAQSVNRLASMGILHGYPDGAFRPDAYLTRAEFATMIAGFDELKQVEGDMYADTIGHWAQDYINAATNRGWVSGYAEGPEPIFKPEENITRTEVMSAVNRMLERRILAEDVPDWAMSFNDIDDTHWAYLDVVEASTRHVFQRKDDGYEIWARPDEGEDGNEVVIDSDGARDTADAAESGATGNGNGAASTSGAYGAASTSGAYGAASTSGASGAASTSGASGAVGASGATGSDGNGDIAINRVGGLRIRRTRAAARLPERDPGELAQGNE